MSDISLTLVRRIRASPDAVFAALTEPAQIARWWGPDSGPVLVSETDVRPGGAFRVRFRMEGGSEHESSGIYEEVVPARRLRMTWRWLGSDDPESIVTFELRPVDDGTELTFTHARLPSIESRDLHREGWSGALAKLEALSNRGEDDDAGTRGRLAGRVDRGQSNIAGAGEGLHARAGSAGGAAPGTPLGAGGEGVRVPGSGRSGDAG